MGGHHSDELSASLQFSSVQFSRSIVSDSVRPHESQHARPPCPSPTPRAHSDSCPSSQWCHPAISSSVVPLSSCPQSLPASESFPMSQLFAVLQSCCGFAGDTLMWLKSPRWEGRQVRGLSACPSLSHLLSHKWYFPAVPSYAGAPPSLAAQRLPV